MSKKIQNEIEGVAIDVLVSILEEIRIKYNLTGEELVRFLDEKGTLQYINNTSLLFGLMHDDEDIGVKIFTGEYFK